MDEEERAKRLQANWKGEFAAATKEEGARFLGVILGFLFAMTVAGAANVITLYPFALYESWRFRQLVHHCAARDQECLDRLLPGRRYRHGSHDAVLLRDATIEPEH